MALFGIRQITRSAPSSSTGAAIGGKHRTIASFSDRLKDPDEVLTVKLNVSGTGHVVRKKCDSYLSDTNEYYFARPNHLFEPILDYECTGELHKPIGLCDSRFVKELAHWQIPSTALSQCCSLPASSSSSALVSSVVFISFPPDRSEDGKDSDSEFWRKPVRPLHVINDAKSRVTEFSVSQKKVSGSFPKYAPFPKFKVSNYSATYTNNNNHADNNTNNNNPNPHSSMFPLSAELTPSRAAMKRLQLSRKKSIAPSLLSNGGIGIQNLPLIPPYNNGPSTTTQTPPPLFRIPSGTGSEQSAGASSCDPSDYYQQLLLMDDPDFWTNGSGGKQHSSVSDKYLRDPFKGKQFSNLRTKLHDLFEEPGSSRLAMGIAGFSILCIMISVLCLILDSMPELKIEPRTTRTTDNEPESHPIFALLEYMCLTWFTFEYVVRWLISPEKWMFTKRLLNVIDLIAILPFYIEILLFTIGKGAGFEKIQNMLLVVRIFRILRVVRLFKLARYSTALKTFAITMKRSAQDLGTLILLCGIFVIVFSVIIHFLEHEQPKSQFRSIPHAMWWCLITMTTVGYGDMVPVTAGGKIVAILTSLVGILVLAFPVATIAEQFAELQEMKKAKELQKKLIRKHQHQQHQNQHQHHHHSTTTSAAAGLSGFSRRRSSATNISSLSIQEELTIPEEEEMFDADRREQRT